ncbi:MAG: THUMP domain-containing protein, partial [Gammaproteobacteria bacterium]|nr:THUMP domain-containing protein [Gammaproteobacteria bacterium]
MNQRTVSEESKTSTQQSARTAGESLNVFATVPRDLVAPLRRELERLGAGDLRAGTAGVRFRAPLEVAYRVCLWSRFASRVLLPLASFATPDAEALYRGVRGIDWRAHVAADGSLAVDFVASRSRIEHARFGAQTVKDAIVDQLRERSGTRPSVATRRPDVRINAHLDRDVATIAIDLAGESLHRRGLRRDGGPAPLKENVAAAVLDFAGWPRMAAAGRPFIDPMCGSATLLIEAALMAADVAPGLEREYFGLEGWLGHDRTLWQALLEEARSRRRDGFARLPPMAGYDADPRAIAAARANLTSAGLEDRIEVASRPIAALASPCPEQCGLLACNPPYGNRLSAGRGLDQLYAD